MKFVDSTGNNLTFGYSGIYNPDEIEFFTVNGTDTTFLFKELVKESGPGNDSLIRIFVNVNVSSDRIFIRLDASDTDTIDFILHGYETRCCGYINEIQKMTYNQQQVFEQFNMVLEFEK